MKLNTESQLVISDHDFSVINKLLAQRKSEDFTLLEDELSKATVVPNESLPKNTVCLNSRITLQNAGTSKETIFTLVLPEEADIEKGKISVLAPMGMALIGLSSGSDYEWPMPDGRHKRFTVIDVQQK